LGPGAHSDMEPEFTFGGQINETQGQPWYVSVCNEVRAHRAVGGRCKGLNDMFSTCEKSHIQTQNDDASNSKLLDSVT
jgi:hypothetical protein